jgi:hypothetical protein
VEKSQPTLSEANELMASRRDKTAGSEWFRKRVDQLLTSPEVLSRLDALRALRDERRCSFDLSRELTIYACMAVSSHQGRPDFLNHYWARGTGKTWKALSQFPNRLERVAEEIERINRADRLFYARRRGNDLSRFELQRLEQNCIQLPTIIQVYAEALRERNVAVSAHTPRSGRLEGLLQLSSLVKFLSGAYHDQAVSELLNTIAYALGEPKSFDALTIAQARSRSKKKLKT